MAEWISVRDRLPLNDTYINVTTDGVVVPAYWHNDRFFAFTAIGVATVGGVTHWMPLPEPPKEEAQQDCTYNKNGHCMGQKLMPECDAKNCDRRK